MLGRAIVQNGTYLQSEAAFSLWRYTSHGVRRTVMKILSLHQGGWEYRQELGVFMVIEPKLLSL